MSDFADNHLTDLGQDLIAGVLAGQTITFTKLVMGDGDMPEMQTPETMTAVISPKAEASITKCAKGESGTAVIGARFTNESQEEAFEWKELGLYAEGPDGTEILYSYGYTPQGELIPASVGGTLIEKLVDVVTYVGDDADVTAIFDPSFIPQVERISETDIDAMWDSDVDPDTGKSSQYLDRPGLSQLVHSIADAIAGAGPTVTADEVTVTMTPEGVLSIKALGVGTEQLADLSVTTAKLADASVTKQKLAPGAIDSSILGDGSVTVDKLADGFVLPVEKGGTGATTAEQARTNLGAAAAEHVHDASDITTGTLPVGRGGTGVTSVDAGFQQYVANFYVQDQDELLAYLGLS